MQIQIRNDPSVFDGLAEEWSNLLHRSVLDTLFVTTEWQGVWWKHFGADRDLRVLLFRDDDGVLQGIAPLYAFEQDGLEVVQLVGGVDVSDYLDFVVAKGWEGEVYDSLLRYLCNQAPPWDLLDLHNLPTQGPTLGGVLSQVHTQCIVGEPQKEEATPYIPLSGDWEAYLAALSKKQRHEIRRKLRRADREARTQWERLQSPERLEAEVEVFLSLHRASHPDKDAFMTPEMEGFFRDMARVTFAREWLNLYTLRLDDQPAASMWCFDYDNCLLVYNSGYDPVYRPELSSGIVLLSYCIQDAIDRGMVRFDFLRGDEPYKYRFGGVDSAVYRLVVQPPDRSGTA